MVRTLASVAVLLAAGAAQSAPPAKIPATNLNNSKIRFLSLPEARAIALEQRSVGQPSLLFPGVGLDRVVQAPQDKVADGTGVLVRGKSRSHGMLLVAPDLNRAEFERNVNQMLLNAENAYWNLYGSYWQLHSREQGLRFAVEVWGIARERYESGKASAADLAQAEGQYNLFRSQRLQALDTVLDNERQLRAILGLPIEDGVRLVPSDAPTRKAMNPDWEKALQVALRRRPELRLAREEVKVARLNYAMTKNVVVPVLRCLGMGGSAPSEGKGDAPTCIRCSWLEGVTKHPGYLRDAQLQLARAHMAMGEQELKAERFLGLYYRRMSTSQAQIKAASAQREAFVKQFAARRDAYAAGDKDATLDLLLEAQRFWADSLATECQAVVMYNNAIAGWAYAKGAIMAHAHVKIAEEAPAGEKVRAVEHEGKRTRSKVRHESGVLANTPMTAPSAVSLPALWKCFPPLRDAGEMPSNVTKGDVRLVEWTVSDIFAPGRKHAH